jgi:hypothetical protein
MLKGGPENVRNVVMHKNIEGPQAPIGAHRHCHGFFFLHSTGYLQTRSQTREGAPSVGHEARVESPHVARHAQEQHGG